jgi:hypothetical protein
VAFERTSLSRFIGGESHGNYRPPTDLEEPLPSRQCLLGPRSQNNGEVVFPFAGYVGMAAEAVREVRDIQVSVSFRRVIVSTALVVHEVSPTEFVTTFRRERLTDSLNSSWLEVTISSHNGHTWLNHCSGEVRADEKPPAEFTTQPESLPRKVDANKWYNMCAMVALNTDRTLEVWSILRRQRYLNAWRLLRCATTGNETRLTTTCIPSS